MGLHLYQQKLIPSFPCLPLYTCDELSDWKKGHKKNCQSIAEEKEKENQKKSSNKPPPKSKKGKLKSERMVMQEKLNAGIKMLESNLVHFMVLAHSQSCDIRDMVRVVCS